MKMNDFVASCLGMDGNVIDEICENFDIDISEEEVFEAFSYSCGNYQNFGREMLRMLYGKIMDDYKDLLEESKFDWDVSSPSYPSFYYDEEVINSKDELDAIVEQLED